MTDAEVLSLVHSLVHVWREGERVFAAHPAWGTDSAFEQAAPFETAARLVAERIEEAAPDSAMGHAARRMARAWRTDNLDPLLMALSPLSLSSSDLGHAMLADMAEAGLRA